MRRRDILLTPGSRRVAFSTAAHLLVHTVPLAKASPLLTRQLLASQAEWAPPITWQRRQLAPDASEAVHMVHERARSTVALARAAYHVTCQPPRVLKGNGASADGAHFFGECCDGSCRGQDAVTTAAVHVCMRLVKWRVLWSPAQAHERLVRPQCAAEGDNPQRFTREFHAARARATQKPADRPEQVRVLLKFVVLLAIDLRAAE